MGGRWTGQAFDASIPGDSLSGEELRFCEKWGRWRKCVRDLEESVEELETLLREMTAGGLIGLKDHGAEDAGERTRI